MYSFHNFLFKHLYIMLLFEIVAINLLPVQISGSVVSDSWRPYWLQYARFLGPSPTPGAYWNSCPLSWWCHPIISSCHCLLLLPSVIKSLLFNMLSRFLPRSKQLLISWLQSQSTVILEPKKIKSVNVSIVSPSICHEVMGLDAISYFFECCDLNKIFNSFLSLSSRGSLFLLHFLP